MAVAPGKLQEWAGEDVPVQDEPGWYGDMARFFEPLLDRYPGLQERLDSIEQAVEDGDDEELSRGVVDLGRYMASQMNQGYPRLTKDERARAAERIAYHMHHREGAREAIAIGLREASPEKYKSYVKRARRIH